MNTRGETGSNLTMAFAVSFNSTRTSFAIAHDAGFSVFRANNGDKILTAATPPLKHAAMIGDSPYMGIASLFGKQPGSADFDMALYNARQNTMMARVDDVKDIRTMHLTEERAVVVCRTMTVIFDLASLERVATIDTAVNESGVCSMSAKKLAIPGRSIGQVQVVELKNGRAQQIIAAHQSGLKAVDLSEDGEYVATASDNGTLFRIYKLSDATKVAELRRGIEQARVFDIRMSPDNQFLAATSEKGTVHVFRLGSVPAEMPPEKYVAGNRESGSPEPIPIPPQSRKSSLSASPIPVGRRTSTAFSPSSPPTKSTLPAHMKTGSPGDFVLVDSFGTAPGPSTAANEPPKSVFTGKYSTLGKLSFAPSFMKAHYPDASNTFSVGPMSAAAASQEMPGAPTRGQIKWVDYDKFVVVRVQPKPFWESYRVGRSVIDGACEVVRLAGKDLPIP